MRISLNRISMNLTCRSNSFGFGLARFDQGLKVVHKNVSQSCHKIRKSESKKVQQRLYSIKVVLCVRHTLLFSKNNLHFHNISITSVDK